MRALKTRTARIVGPALALAAVAVLALSGVATAKDHGGHARRHHHGHRHILLGPQETGKIASFDATTGKLTITLNEGESVTGLVTEDTEIKCPAPEEGVAQRRDGSGEPGDDGEHEEEPGDDDGGDSGQSWSGDHSGDEGDSEGCDHHESGQGSCTTASLTVGTVVGAAELRLEGGKAVFTEIDLGAAS
ncbi:MAG TPA: hypothetical protein VJL81_03195 [Solirubrobacterales bacterium]|nr:hypothetical protein [Solirubrobacterales bacterium]